MNFGAIGQGFGESSESCESFDGIGSSVTTVGEILVASLRDDEFHSATFVVAFATESGVNVALGALDESGLDDVKCYVGADRNATTKQALTRLRDSEIETSWIRLHRSDLTYHPKVYLFEGEEKARAVVGSANLTRPALRENVEAAFVFERSAAEADDGDPIDDLKTTLVDPVRGVSEPLTPSAIEELEERGYIGDETDRSYVTASSGSDIRSDSGDSVAPLGASLDVTVPDLPTGGSSTEDTSDRSSDDDGIPSLRDLPPVPHRNLEELSTKTDRAFYRRLRDGTDNQPSIMRRIIYDESEITQGELKRRLIENHGYDDSGSLDASLRVLWRITDEVDKQGKGTNARLVWVGNDRKR